jgi:hypothetical protein
VFILRSFCDVASEISSFDFCQVVMMQAHLRLSLLSVTCLLGLLMVGCEKPSNPVTRAPDGEALAVKPSEQEGAVKPADSKAKEANVAKPKFRYSPFVLKVNAKDSVFKTVSFKDVGVNGVPDEERAVLYETIAESLAYGLSEDRQLSMTSSVVYDKEILDPNNHLACGSDHLYVDVWRSKQRWGYSLWSGCGEEDNFAWKEIEYTPDADVTSEIDPLTRDILSTLRTADSKGCYQKAC